MENPFVYGKIVRDKYFADRKAEIAELINDITSGQNVIVFSPRRYEDLVDPWGLRPS